MRNTPTELELLRRVASAAEWAIETNGDHVVGRDGRSRVGINEVLAHGALNKALGELRERYGIDGRLHIAEREEARGLMLQMQAPLPTPGRRKG